MRTSALVNKGVPKKDVLPKYCPDKPPLVNPPPFARVLLLTAKSPTYAAGLRDEEGIGANEGEGVDVDEGGSPSLLRSVVLNPMHSTVNKEITKNAVIRFDMIITYPSRISAGPRRSRFRKPARI
jgi:hypothetical protein